MNTTNMITTNRWLMFMRMVLCFFVIGLLLTGCTDAADPVERPIERTKEQIKFSTVHNKTGTDQQPANKAKDTISSFEEITNIYAVNSTSKLLVAIDVAHHHRLQLEKIRDNVKRSLEMEFPQIELHISTDEKILKELEILEQSIHKNNVTSFEIEKKVDEVLSLSKEQT